MFITKNILKTFSILLTFVFAFSSVTYAVQPAAVTICHATGSASNPWNEIHTNVNALNGHDGHAEDLILEGNVTCPSTPQVPEFGLITGAVAALGGAGSYLVLKKRSL